jgi:hypothetical protein
MKLRFLSLSLINSDKIIKNINIPSCKNCIYYKPNILHNDFTSQFNKCEKFGEKDIITDIIRYNFADFCRNDESMCGKEGTYFEEEKNIKFKIFKYKIISSLPYSLPIIMLAINLFIKVLFRK